MSDGAWLWMIGVGGIAVAGLLAVGFYAWRIEPHWVQLRHVSLPLAGLSERWQDRRVIAIGDLHVGPVVCPRYLRRVIQQVNDLKPHLLLLLGDFMTCDADEQLEAVDELMAELQAPPLGALAVLGNHDYGADSTDCELADALVALLSRRGIRVLRNEVVEVEGLQVGGVDELWSGLADVRRVLSAIDHSRPSLILCHQPDGIDDPAWRNVAGSNDAVRRMAVLSGHTHGAQVNLPVLRSWVVPSSNRSLIAGRYDRPPLPPLYVHRGIGYIRRLRLLARPEITCLSCFTDQAVRST